MKHDNWMDDYYFKNIGNDSGINSLFYTLGEIKAANIQYDMKHELSCFAALFKYQNHFSVYQRDQIEMDGALTISYQYVIVKFIINNNHYFYPSQPLSYSQSRTILKKLYFCIFSLLDQHYDNQLTPEQHRDLIDDLKWWGTIYQADFQR